MTKKIRNFTVYNDVRIELSNEGIKVIYRDTIKILREIMDRLGILYGKMENPQSLSHHQSQSASEINSLSAISSSDI